MRYPEKLKAGAVIGLVSPSSPVSEERQEACCKVMRSMGFRVKKADNISASKGGYMAGEEKVRGEWINRMFADPEVEAIFCIRGGDGANRIIPYIDLDVVRKNPKIFQGYSDITSLHLLFNQKCDLVTFHGPMISSNVVDQFDDETKKGFFESLTADEAYTYCPPEGFPIGAAREGCAEGEITGGNLTVLCASVGTPYEIETRGKILFIEEIGEHIGNLDRHVYQLKNAGLLDEVKGIILGQFARCEVDEEGFDMTRVVMDAIGDMDIPVMYNVQSGHGFPMITLPMGAVCRMDTETKSIVFETGR